MALNRASLRDPMEKDGRAFLPFWENVCSWWAIRDLPNVKLIHFSDLKWI